MDPLQVRESEVFEALKGLGSRKFVVIGGYAVNAYALPRFSVDCDIVVGLEAEHERIGKVLLRMGYERAEFSRIGPSISFARYEKILPNSFKVSFDVLIGGIHDRQTGVSIPSGWVFKHSEVKTLKGKTITEKLKLRVVDIDALFVLKMLSCRYTDIRDLFMLVPGIKDRGWVKGEVSSRYDFMERFRKILDTVNSKKFRDGLQGVYGLVDGQTFQKSVDAIVSLNDEQ
ncbi:MAG: hypothetical protein KGH66_00505 [Candidatus Micrarchaeota archaeon]|nr:hypothetical protein [Candidatus Micrarchaeota archaeon]